MNGEQLEKWLTELSSRPYLKCTKANKLSDDGNECRKFLHKEAQNTQALINYIACNYQQVELVQPLIGQVLVLYYRLGPGRFFAFQIITPLIYLYLVGLQNGQQGVVSMFETFFLAIYNEEILAEGPGSDSHTKRIDQVQIPSIRFPSVYHDPSKLISYSELSELRLSSSTATLCSVQVGPYPAAEYMIGENRYMILSRIVMLIGSSLSYLCADVVCKPFCEMVQNIACSGFRFDESNLREKILDVMTSQEAHPDLSNKPRMFAPSYFYIEALTIINFCIFNGFANAGLRSLDAIHQRAVYDISSDVLLVTNSLRDLLRQEDACSLIRNIESRPYNSGENEERREATEPTKVDRATVPAAATPSQKLYATFDSELNVFVLFGTEP